MRKEVLLVAVVLTACSKAEAPKADTTAAAPVAAPAPPPPAALTAADLAGTWHGETKLEGKDSVVAKWTVVKVTDSTGTLTYEGTKVAIPYSIKFDADSMIAVSRPYTAPKAKVKQVFHSVGWLKDGKLSGHSTATLASKPDSVLSKATWVATKAP